MRGRLWCVVLLAVGLAAGVLAQPDPAQARLERVEQLWRQGRWAGFLSEQQLALPALAKVVPAADVCFRAAVACHLVGRQDLPAEWLAACEQAYGPASGAARACLKLIVGGQAAFWPNYQAFTRSLGPQGDGGALATVLGPLPPDAAKQLGADGLLYGWRFISAMRRGAVADLQTCLAEARAGSAEQRQLVGQWLAQAHDEGEAGRASRERLSMALCQLLVQHQVDPSLVADALPTLVVNDRQRVTMIGMLGQAGLGDLARRLASEDHSRTTGTDFGPALATMATLYRGGQTSQAVALGHRIMAENSYPRRWLARAALWEMLAGGPGRYPPVPPFIPAGPLPPGAPDPALHPMTAERKAVLAAVAAAPGDLDARFAAADLVGLFTDKKDEHEAYRELFGAATDRGMKLAAWLAWAQWRPRDAWPELGDLRADLLAWPDAAGLRVLTYIGLASARPDDRGRWQSDADRAVADGLVDLLPPVWAKTGALDPALGSALARMASLSGRIDAALTMLPPPSAKYSDELDELLSARRELPSVLGCRSMLYGVAADHARRTAGSHGLLQVRYGLGVVEQLPATAVGGLWCRVVAASGQDLSAAADEARVALRQAVLAKVRTAHRVALEQFLAQAAWPARASRGALLPEVRAMVKELLILCPDPPETVMQRLNAGLLEAEQAAQQAAQH